MSDISRSGTFASIVYTYTFLKLICYNHHLKILKSSLCKEKHPERLNEPTFNEQIDGEVLRTTWWMLALGTSVGDLGMD